MRYLSILFVLTVPPMAAAQPAPAAPAQQGITYRFKAGTAAGQVWVLGEQSRSELEAAPDGTAGRIEIWKDGGRQVLVLDAQERTYYDRTAFERKNGLENGAPSQLDRHRPTLRELSADAPFVVNRVSDVVVDIKTLPARERVEGHECTRAIVSFSYTLTLSLQRVPGTFPGRVNGTLDVCAAQPPEWRAGSRIRSDHDMVLITSHPEVDRLVAARLSAIAGVPVARMLKVTRKIEGGETVDVASGLLLSDIKFVDVTTDRFELPDNYQLKEPTLVAPIRR